MKVGKVSASIASLIASGSLGVDAMVYDGEILVPVTETIASEQVEVRQVDTVIEAKAPWKGEEGLTVSYDLGQPTFAENLRDRRKEEVIYERVDFGDGGFKIDVLLTEKPDTNRFCYAIEGYENYDFFYQPPLTAEEIAEGASRPPEIEGSYAVYHKTLKNNGYKTGKVMHIPRPQVWEIGNEETTKRWADLLYTDGQLCVTAPQDFIDNADYTNGVRIDPTFGYATCGASITTVGIVATDGSTRLGHAFTLSEYSTLTSLEACVSSNDAAITETADTTVFLNIEDTVTDSHTEVAASERLDILYPIISTSQNYSFTTSQEILNPGTNYILSIAIDGEDLTAVDVGVRADTGFRTTNLYQEARTGVGSYDLNKESPWTEDEQTSTNIRSIYATFEPIADSTIRLDNATIRINNGTLNI